MSDRIRSNMNNLKPTRPREPECPHCSAPVLADDFACPTCQYVLRPDVIEAWREQILLAPALSRARAR